jgi:hypothetical protein
VIFKCYQITFHRHLTISATDVAEGYQLGARMKRNAQPLDQPKNSSGALEGRAETDPDTLTSAGRVSTSM